MKKPEDILIDVQAQKHPLDNNYKFLSLLIPADYPHVTIVALDRPKKLNAIHAALWREIGHVFGQLGTLGDDCRCVLLTGSGRGFCAGIDIQDLSFTETESTTDDPARKGLAMIRKVKQMQACFSQLEQCPVPVVVAIHGVCVGAGIDLACCADIRLCTPSALFSVREVRMGLAADVGTLQRLPKITGNDSLVNDVSLTGRNFTSEEARNMGFVSRLLQEENFLGEALKVCQSIAMNSPIAVVGTKKALLYARDHSVTDSLEQIISYNAMALQSEDLPLSIAAAMQKQRAKFATIPAHSKL